MLIKLTQSNEIAKYPYQISDLRQDHPNTGFPDDLDGVDLSGFNVAAVEITARPAINMTTEDAIEAEPEFVGGRWVQQWSVRPASPEVRQARVAEFCRQIDADVDAIYGAVQGNRATEYLIAESDASGYKAAGYVGDVPPSVACWATAKTQTSQWAADDILSTAAAWRSAQSNIRATRLACKEAARIANDAYIAKAQWSTFLATIKATLGLT